METSGSGANFPVGRVVSRFSLILAAAVAVSAASFAFYAAYGPDPARRPVLGQGRLFRDGEFLGPAVIPLLKSAIDRNGFEQGLYRIDLALDLPSSDFAEGVYAGADPVIVFPSMGGNSLSVRFNGEVLGVRGDPVRGDASIWNAAHVFPVPFALIRNSNSVTVEIRGVYEAGITKTPYLIDADRARLRLFLLSLFTEQGIWISIGVALTAGSIILGAGMLRAQGMDERILTGFACILLAFILLDYADIDRLPVSLLLFKRVVTSSRHLSSLVMTFAALSIVRRKLDPFAAVFAFLQAISFVAVLAAPVDMVGLKRLYSVTYLAILPLPAYILYLFIVFRNVGLSRFLLLGGGMAALLSCVFDSVNMYFALGAPYVAHYGIGLLMFCVALYVIRDMLVQYRSLAAEQRRSAVFHAEALRDPLTGAFNRALLDEVGVELPALYSVIFLDLDDFKHVNDTYGHAAGDLTLKAVVAAMRSQLRSQDYVVRFGGDEFIAILPDCPVGKAAELAGRIVAAVASLPSEPILPNGAAGCTVSAGVSQSGDDRNLFLAISRADEGVYASKRAGKNRVSVASS